MRQIIFSLTVSVLIISCGQSDTNTQSTSSSSENESAAVFNASEILLSKTESLAGGTNIYDDKYQIGRGFNSSTNEVLAPAVVYTDTSDLTTVSQTEGIFTDVDVKRITTYDQLKSFMNLNISGNAKYGWLKVSAKVEKFKQVEWNSYSDFLVAKVVVYNPSKILKKANLDTAALKRLKNNVQDFLDFYGDQYISGIKTGGELYVLYQFNSFSRAEKDSTSAAINVAVSAFTGSAKTSVSLKQSLSTLTDKKNLSVRIIRTGDDDSVNVKDPNALLDYVEKFPKIVNTKGNKAALIYAFTDDIFSTKNFPLGIPKTSKNLIISQGEKLTKIYKKLEAIDLANNDLNFIKANNTKFKPNEIESLDDDVSTNKDLQEQLEACATRCHNSIQNCDVCQPLLDTKIKKLKPSTIENIPAEPEFVLSISDKIIPNSNEYVEVCRIPNGKQAKIEFKGKLLSPSDCFDPFVSAYNNDKAQGWQIGGYFLKKAYPIIEIQIINQDGTKTEALRYSDRIKIIDSKNGETIIKAGLKVYIVGSQGATETWQFGVYITECDAGNKPRADVYLK